MPDVVIYDLKRDWLFVIDALTQRRHTFEELITRYNAIVDSCETDPSLKIEVARHGLLPGERALLDLGWHVVTIWACALESLAAREWLKRRLSRLLGDAKGDGGGKSLKM